MEKIVKLKKTPQCLNCHADIGELNYCPNCGQQNVDRAATLKDFFHDALGDFFTYDHKFFRSFKPLLLKPGFLTNEYNSGRRVNYILPLRLYVFISLVFFFFYALKGMNDEGVVNIGTFKPVTADSISNYIFSSASIDSIQTYQFVLEYSKTYDMTIGHNNGLKWKYFLQKFPNMNDSVQHALGYDLAWRFDLDKEKEPENTVRDSIRLFTVLRTVHGFTKTQSENIYFKLDSIYEFTYQFQHPNQRNRSYFEKEINEITFNARDGKILTDQLLRDFIFEDSRDTIDYREQVKDSLNLSFLQEIGFNFVDQAKKIAQMEDAGRIVGNAFFDLLPKVIFILLPIFAMILKLFYVRQKIFYLNHLIFALHTHSIVFIYLLLGIIVDIRAFYFVMIFASWIHVYLSFRAVYSQGWFLTFFKYFGIIAIYNLFVGIGLIIGVTIAFFQV